MPDADVAVVTFSGNYNAWDSWVTPTRIWREIVLANLERVRSADADFLRNAISNVFFVVQSGDCFICKTRLSDLMLMGNAVV